jgi:hypothetical protein
MSFHRRFGLSSPPRPRPVRREPLAPLVVAAGFAAIVAAIGGAAWLLL